MQRPIILAAFLLLTTGLAQAQPPNSQPSAAKLFSLAQVEEQLQSQGNYGNRLPTIIQLYQKIVRERYDSAEAPLAADRLKALGAPIPTPDRSFSVTQVNKALAAFACRDFLQSNGTMPRQWARDGDNVDEIYNKWVALIAERFSLGKDNSNPSMAARCDGLCPIPGCPKAVTGRVMCAAHQAEAKQYVAAAHAQTQAANRQLKVLAARAAQINTPKAYDDLRTAISARGGVANMDLQVELERDATARGRALERAKTATLHVAPIQRTPTEQAKYVQRYEKALATARAQLEGTLVSKVHGNHNDTTQEIVDQFIRTVADEFRNDQPLFKPCPVPECTTTTRASEICQAHQDAFTREVQERVAYYEAHPEAAQEVHVSKVGSAGPITAKTFEVRLEGRATAFKDYRGRFYSREDGATVREAIDKALAAKHAYEYVQGLDGEWTAEIGVGLGDYRTDVGHLDLSSKKVTGPTLKDAFKAAEIALHQRAEVLTREDPAKHDAGSDRQMAWDQVDTWKWVLANWGQNDAPPAPVAAPKADTPFEVRVRGHSHVTQEHGSFQSCAKGVTVLDAIKNALAQQKEFEDAQPYKEEGFTASIEVTVRYGLRRVKLDGPNANGDTLDKALRAAVGTIQQQAILWNTHPDRARGLSAADLNFIVTNWGS